MIDHKSQRKQFDLIKREFSRAREYASEYQGKTPIAHFFNTRMRRVSEAIGDIESGIVLDIGCGPARIARIFRGKQIDYYGVDISFDMIQTCIDDIGVDAQLHFSIGSIEDLGFQDASFDVVLCLGVFEYVLDIQRAVREVARVLRPGGILIATMLNMYSPYELWERYGHGRFSGLIKRMFRLRKVSKKEKEVMEEISPKRPKTTLLRENAFNELLTSGGLNIIDTLYYDFAIIPSPLDHILPRVSVGLSQSLEFLCRSKLKYLGRGIMVVSRMDTLI